jgi:hypothetical protein
MANVPRASSQPLTPISFAVDFFDIKYARNDKRYTIKALHTDFDSWHDLDILQECELLEEVFRVGQYVSIYMMEEGDDSVVNHCEKGEGQPEEEDGNYAQIREIRALPSPDERILIRVAWCYREGNKFYNSNHYQVLLWDTISARMAQDMAEEIPKYVIYDACLESKVCGRAEAVKWRKMEREVFTRCSSVSRR